MMTCRLKLDSRRRLIIRPSRYDRALHADIMKLLPLRKRVWSGGAWRIDRSVAEAAIDILALHKIAIVWDN